MFIIISMLAVLPMVLSLLNKRDFVQIFGFLSIFFVIAFYILPLNLVYYSNSVRYIGQPVIFSAQDFSFSLICLLLFSLGFASFDFFKFTKKGSLPYIARQTAPLLKYKYSSLNKLDYAVILIIAFICFNFYTSSQYFIGLEGRQGKSDADQLTGLITICIYYLGSIILIELLEKKKYILGFIHFLLLFFLALNFAGRVQVILVIAILSLNFIKSPKVFYAFFVLAIIAFFPLILNGKEIIYTLFYDPYSLIYIGKYYSEGIDVNALMNNFGHPLISLYYADVTINSIGYRFFWDIFHGLIFYLNFFGWDTGQSLTYFNTETILFVKQSVIPPGYLAFGFIQAGYFGVFAMGLFFRSTGAIVGKINAISNRSSLTRDFFWAFIAANTFYAGEVRVLVLTYLLPVLIYMGYLRLKRGQQVRDRIEPSKHKRHRNAG